MLHVSCVVKVKIKRFDKTIDLPSYKTLGAACVDLYSREIITIKAHKVGLIPLNIAIQIPKNHFGMLIARSSTHKMGILAANGVGILDSDYCGDNDEISFAALNFTGHEVTIEKATRIAQLMILSYKQTEIIEVSKLKNKDRGGFGSTGKN